MFVFMRCGASEAVGILRSNKPLCSPKEQSLLKQVGMSSRDIVSEYGVIDDPYVGPLGYVEKSSKAWKCSSMANANSSQCTKSNSKASNSVFYRWFDNWRGSGHFIYNVVKLNNKNPVIFLYIQNVSLLENKCQ